MKQFLNIFFVTMGVIFTLLICISIYLYITDPWNIKPMIQGSKPSPSIPAQEEVGESVTSTETIDSNTTSPTADSSFTLSDEQKQALVSFGIDPSTIPSTISSEIEACFVANLGEQRVREIKAGAVPGALEFLKAKPCI